LSPIDPIGTETDGIPVLVLTGKSTYFEKDAAVGLGGNISCEGSVVWAAPKNPGKQKSNTIRNRLEKI
jgi:hypothetical protein